MEVEPIREKKQLENMKRYLRERSLRDHTLFVLGINSGLRISDLLKLKVSDVQNQDRICLTEKKTGKKKNFPLSDNCKKIIREYLKDTGLIDGWLFPNFKTGKPIGRIQLWRILNHAADMCGIKESIGTHTMRKTFGYHAYLQGVDVTRIQQLLNHSTPSVTLRYIGITRDELDQIYINLNL